jgi:hypothetical protein
MNENPIYGSGQHSHRVPTVIDLVVEMRDAQHAGTAVWRRDHRNRPYCFASYDDGRCGFAERCVLVRGQDLDTIEFDDCCACCTEVPDGLLLRGIDADDDLSWLSEGATVLWDSKEV